MHRAFVFVGYEKKFICILDFWSTVREAMQKRVLLLTGNPRVGKTTVLIKTVNALKEKGYRVGGMTSREARENRNRVGFEILDLNSGTTGWLAHVNQQTGPQVGKYRVNREHLDLVGAKAIADALENCPVVAIDEIGPMELFSEKFKEATRKTLASSKPVVAVVHWKARDKLINEAKIHEDSETFTVTQENRDKLPEIITQKTLQLLK
jgi:nucleoside-triphosphatase